MRVFDPGWWQLGRKRKRSGLHLTKIAQAGVPVPADNLIAFWPAKIVEFWHHDLWSQHNDYPKSGS
jgi:hypothetical protein